MESKVEYLSVFWDNDYFYEIWDYGRNLKKDKQIWLNVQQKITNIKN